MIEEPIVVSSELDNQRNLRRLLLSIRSSFGKLNLLVAICDNPKYRDELIQAYETELAAAGVDCVRLRLDRQQPSLKDVLSGSPIESGSKPKVVTIFGADELLSMRLGEAKSAQEKFFFSVQWTREGLRAFPYPIVLWVTEEVAVGLGREAPDFWSWRGGVFEFVRSVVYERVSRDKIAEKDLTRTTMPSQTIANPVELTQQIEALQASDPDSPLLASLSFNLGNVYSKRIDQGTAAYYRQERQLAVKFYQQAIKRQEDTATTDLASSLNNLAVLYREMGRYEEAEPLYKRSLAISETQLGPDHPDTGISLNNLASLYESMGHYDAAEPLYERSLAISETQLGPDHPDTGTSLNNLASLYESMGHYDAAEPLYKRSLAIRETQLGPDHPSTGTSLNNLAGLYEAMSRYDAAEPLYKRSLAIREAQLGPNHPSTGSSLNNLAELYREMGRYDAAEPLYKRSLAISEAELGPNHPSTGSSLNNLALLYREMGRYEEAEPLYKRSLSIREAQLGPEHPDTGRSLNNLALLYKSICRYSEAEPLYLRGLQVLTKSLPEGHLNIKTVEDNFRHLLVAAVQTGQTSQLSDHPITQSLLAQIQEHAETV
jgi:tetratricopeptide (TPR) repeat protein